MKVPRPRQRHADKAQLSAAWTDPFSTLRAKWSEVPGGSRRLKTAELLLLSDEALLQLWQEELAAASCSKAFGVRGWYHLLYSDVLKGKRVMDFGCGLGFDGLTFARQGARVSLVDIVKSNVDLARRLGGLLQITDAAYLYVDSLGSLKAVSGDYDVMWCQGSLINAPFSVVRAEAQILLEHLPVGGRWVELCYPRGRWEREGRPPFHAWGAKTDGGAPWMEWYDLEKLMARLEPARFDVVLSLEFCNGDFNWFDLVRVG